MRSSVAATWPTRSTCRSARSRTRGFRTPSARGGKPYAHAIELYWETGNEAARYLNIANAKWRGSDKVDQPEVLLLAQVPSEVAAHKAFMLTTVGFTAGALAAAQHHGIALHVVRRTFDVGALPAEYRAQTQRVLEDLTAYETKPYTGKVELRAREPTIDRAVHPAVGSGGYSTRALGGYETKAAGGGGESRGGGGSVETRGGGGYPTKGGGPSRGQ